jgi:ADP-ribosylglycohydrolase
MTRTFRKGYNVRGAIIGDIIGSAYEFNPIKTKDFELFPPKARFTDDSVLTIATAVAILQRRSYKEVYAEFTAKYPKRGYGGRFAKWIESAEKEPYNSFGNGSAMRISPVGWAFPSLIKTMDEAEKSAEVTHNHERGIMGAKAVAGSIFLARNGSSKDDIKHFLKSECHYDIGHKISKIREIAVFDETCPLSVEQAIDCFLQADSFEDSVRNAVSLGADADTQACIAGSIAEAFYQRIPTQLISQSMMYLSEELKNIVTDFCAKYV